MGISGRSDYVREFERRLQETNPYLKTLYRALPYNCTDAANHPDGRVGANRFCPTCHGTGYVGVVAQSNNAHLLTSACSQRLFFVGEIQLGHGLYGVGGDLIKLLPDLGRLEIGDALAFVKREEVDRTTGTRFFPDIQGTRPRPDYVQTIEGKLLTVVKQMPLNYGDEVLCRVLTLENGMQGIA